MIRSLGLGLAATSIAFLGGMKVQEIRARDLQPADPVATNTRTRPNAERPARHPSSDNDADRLQAAKGDGVASAAQPVLRVGPQVDRLRRFIAMLDGMTPDNWEKLLRIMADETRDHGRFQQQEWDLALRQAGRIDGARAASVYAGKGDDESLRKILAGWAQADPDAAWKWMESYKDESGRRDVWRGVLTGIAEQDPSEAMRRLDSLPFEVKGGTISFLIAPMVQAEGIDATADRIKRIYADYKTKDPSTISTKEREYVYAFFHNVCDIKRNAGYSPEKRMEALELLSEFPDLARRSPWLLPRTVESVAKDDPAKAMEIAARVGVSDNILEDPRGVDEVAKVWREKNPAGLEQWIEANRGTPAAKYLENPGKDPFAP